MNLRNKAGTKSIKDKIWWWKRWRGISVKITKSEFEGISDTEESSDSDSSSENEASDPNPIIYP